MSFGLVVYDQDGQVSLDTSSFTVRLVTQRRINLGWMGYNQVSSVAVPEARAGMFAILTPMHSYDGISSLQSSLETGWKNPHAPVSTPYVQVYNGYVEIRAHGISPYGLVEDYTYIHRYQANERKFVTEWKYVNKPIYKNVPETRQVCGWENESRYDYNLKRYVTQRVYKCKMQRVDNWKWVDNWTYQSESKWVDNWVWKEDEKWVRRTGTTSRTSGNIMLYLFTNH